MYKYKTSIEAAIEEYAIAREKYYEYIQVGYAENGEYEWFFDIEKLKTVTNTKRKLYDLLNINKENIILFDNKNNIVDHVSNYKLCNYDHEEDIFVTDIFPDYICSNMILLIDDKKLFEVERVESNNIYGRYIEFINIHHNEVEYRIYKLILGM